MPLYGYELIGEPYKVVKSLSKIDCYFYKLILIEAKEKYKNKHKHDVASRKFCNSIKISKNETDFILARFDNPKSDDKYSANIKEYLAICNKLLNNDKVNTGFDYSTDNPFIQIANFIFGASEDRLDEKLREFKKLNKNRNVMYDISGTYDNGAIILMKKVKK